MKLLILDEEFPYPTNTGKRTRSFNLYRRLARRFDIRYVGYGTPGGEAAEALSAAGMEPIPVPQRVASKQGPFFYLRLLANLVSPLPYIVTSHYSRVYQEVVRSNLSDFKPDVVLCEWTPYAVYARNISSARKLISAHNVEADIWKRYYDNEQHVFRRWYIKEQWRKVEKFERAALGWVDGVFAVSELDNDQMKQIHGDLRTTVIPNGVDLNYFRPTPQPESRRHVVFTGSMDWRPNQDAARYFVRDVLPLLRQQRPDLECTFVGRSPPADIRTLGDVPGVHITGTVDDVRSYVDRAAVYVVPLRIGGGSRLKILEAMAMGRAVVSTSVGAEGLDVVHDRHLLLADDPRSFAESVLRLLDRPGRCAELAEHGRHLVEEHYGWDALASRLGEYIQSMG